MNWIWLPVALTPAAGRKVHRVAVHRADPTAIRTATHVATRTATHAATRIAAHTAIQTVGQTAGHTADHTVTARRQAASARCEADMQPDHRLIEGSSAIQMIRLTPVPRKPISARVLYHWHRSPCSGKKPRGDRRTLLSLIVPQINRLSDCYDFQDAISYVVACTGSC